MQHKLTECKGRPMRARDWATWDRAARALMESAERMKADGGEAASTARLARQARVAVSVTLTGLARTVVRVTRERCASTGASTSFVYSLSDEEGADVDPKKFWEDEGVESVAFMRRLADDDAAAGGGPAASCAPDGARGGENRAVWGLTVARKRGARGAEPGGARAGAGEEDAGDQSGCFIVTTTSASCSLVGSGGDCHLCTRFTLTPACRRVDGSRQANEIVDTSWLL